MCLSSNFSLSYLTVCQLLKRQSKFQEQQNVRDCDIQSDANKTRYIMDPTYKDRFKINKVKHIKAPVIYF